MRTGHTHRLVVRRTMDIDITAHAVYRTEPIAAGLTTAKPENSGQYPVAVRVAFGQFGRIDLSGRATPDQNRATGEAGADPRPDYMTPSRRTFAVCLFARAVTRSRYRVARNRFICNENRQLLARQIDLDASPGSTFAIVVQGLLMQRSQGLRLQREKGFSTRLIL